MKRNAITRRGFLGAVASAPALLAGCSSSGGSDAVDIEVVSYKQEATSIMEQLQDEFNATHEGINLTISSPAEAVTVLKTRFVREDYPDIIGIGGDADFANFLDAEILADVSDYPGLTDVNDAYLDILDSLEYVPTEGVYGIPYVANAAGILYNADMFDEHGWSVPETWDEFIGLCETIKAEGVTPLYFGFLDTWTCLAPWNAIAVQLAPEDLCQQVNMGEATFAEHYRESAEKYLRLLDYCEDGPFAYGYNDACTAFARGQSAMYPIGSYAIPQILSVNPDMNIGSMVFPATERAEDRVLNSGVDLQWCVCEACEHKDAAYEVIGFLMEADNLQTYVSDQTAVPCQDGNFEMPGQLDGMAPFIEEGSVVDFQDHHYPSSMSVDAKLQTFLIEGDVDAFLEDFDTSYQRYNRDVIRKVQEYYENQA